MVEIGKKLIDGLDWKDIFPGVAAVNLTADGTGLALSLRLTKKEGTPIYHVPEGTPGAHPVAIKRVNETDFYNLGAKQLAEKVGLTMPKTLAFVEYLGLRSDSDCYKEIKIGKSVHKMYSQRAIQKIQSALSKHDPDEIWKNHQMKIGSKK
jgi:hypothetical protein